VINRDTVEADRQTAHQLEAMRQEVAELRAALVEIRGSTSWRMTEPVRKLGRLIGRSARR